MSQITFTAYLKPQPQGSMKYRGHRKGKPLLTSDNAALKGMRDLLGWAARDAMEKSRLALPMAKKHVAVEVVIEFTFTRPASAKKREQMIVKPDLDKLARAAFDSCTGILWHDDAQVVSATISKVYGPQEQVHISARVMD